MQWPQHLTFLALEDDELRAARVQIGHFKLQAVDGLALKVPCGYEAHIVGKMFVIRIDVDQIAFIAQTGQNVAVVKFIESEPRADQVVRDVLRLNH